MSSVSLTDLGVLVGLKQGRETKIHDKQPDRVNKCKEKRKKLTFLLVFILSSLR